MIEIQPIGSFYNLDENGALINLHNAATIVEPWLTAVNEITATYKRILGKQLHSVYIRGSVASGIAMQGISDIDSLAIHTGKIYKETQKELKDAQLSLSTKFKFATGVEITARNLEKVMTTEPNITQFILKTTSVCVFGENLIAKIKPFKPDAGIIYDLPNLERDDAGILKDLEESKSIKETQEICEWIMKRVLRCGMELTLVEKKKFTRDLYPCYQIFIERYPQQADNMKQVLTLALNPTAESQKIIDLLDEIVPWMLDKYKLQLQNKKV